MPHNTKEAANIFVRNITPDDHIMLEKLREATHEKHNTGAVMTASRRYLSLLEREKELERDLRIAQTTIERLQIKMEHLGQQVSKYILLKDTKQQMEDQILRTINEKVDASDDDEEKDEDAE